MKESFFFLFFRFLSFTQGTNCGVMSRVLCDRRLNPEPMHLLNIFLEALVHHPMLLHHRRALELGRLNEHLVHAPTPACTTWQI